MKNIQFSGQLINELPNNLPDGVELKVSKVEPAENKRPDVEAKLVTGNKEFPVVIEVQNTGGTATLREAARQVKEYGSQSGAIPFVAGQFFGERARQVAKEEGVGLMDLAGNFYLKSGDVLVEKIVEKNPKAQKSPLKNLFAPVSSRITRVLLVEPQRNWLLKDISTEADVSLGQTYQVMDRMIEEEFIKKTEEKKLVLNNPAGLLEEWKKIYPNYRQQKYSFYSYKNEYMAILNEVLKAGQQEKLFYALGFFTGADMIAPFIRGITKVQMYISSLSDLDKWQKVLELQKVDSGGNVELYVPYDKGVFYRTQQIPSKIVGDIPVVNNVQLYMDLFNNPARGAEQAEHLREVKLQF